MKKATSVTAVIISCCVILAAAGVVGCGDGEPEVQLKDPTRQAVDAASEEQMLTFNDVIDMEAVSEYRISPDGLRVAWAVNAARLYLADVGDLSGSQIDLPGNSTVTHIAWSPDSRRIAFAADAPLGDAGETGLPQVWVLDPERGETSPVTTAPQGVVALSWAGPDRILYTSPEGGPEERPDDDTVRVSDYGDTPVRLFGLDLTTQEVEKLSDNDDRIISVSASPDGKYVFYTRTECAQDIYLWQWQQIIPFNHYVLELDSGEERQVFEESRWIVGGGGQWSPDSATLYVLDNYSEDEVLMNYLTLVRTLDVESGREEQVDLGWERGIDQMNSLAYGCLAPVDGGFLTLLADGAYPKVARYTDTGSGWEQSIPEGEHQGNIFSFDAAEDGKTICYNHSTANDPSQLYIGSINGDAIDEDGVLTDLNPGLKEKNLGRAEIITWIGASGDVIEGTLHYPPGYRPDERYPLVLSIHGGPPECVSDVFVEAWHWPVRLMAQKGALVLTANYHGSLNYGLDFQKSLLGGNYYSLPIEDFEAGIDRLDELGMIDTEKLGTMGWSNGGILSNALIAHDQRFKAASCGAGGAEWISDWAVSWFGQSLTVEWFADPVEDPDYFIDPGNAPFYDAEKVKTPVIMFHGEKDRNVATSMSWVTYRGIQKYGETPVELYLFPGEPHMLQSKVHQLRKLEEESKWFDKYLFGAGD